MARIELCNINQQVVDNRNRKITKYYNRLKSTVLILKDDLYSKNLGFLYRTYYECFVSCDILKIARATTYTFLFYSFQLGLAIFKLASNPGREVVVRFGNTDVKTIGKETHDYIHPAYWKQVYNLATIMRDDEALEFLNSVDIKTLLKTNVTVDSYDIADVNFFKNINNKTNRADLLYDAILSAENPKYIESNFKVSSPQEMQFGEDRREIMHNLTIPLLQIYEKIFNSDNEGFNKAIIKRLTNYKDYIIKNKIEGNTGWWIDRHLLAALAFAHENGMSIEVESDYIPAWLYKGEFERLEPEFV